MALSRAQKAFSHVTRKHTTLPEQEWKRATRRKRGDINRDYRETSTPKALKTCGRGLKMSQATKAGASFTKRVIIVPVPYLQTYLLTEYFINPPSGGPKKSAVSSLNDCHPVALTPILMKCFEKLSLQHIQTTSLSAWTLTSVLSEPTDPQRIPDMADTQKM